MLDVSSTPLVSVIVPVWNAEKYILATLESIRNQDFRDIEVLIVDDCSTDISPEIISKFCAKDSRFRYLRSPSNFGGPAGPRNIGLDAAKGEFVAFCDADDLWVAHKLSIQLAAIRETGAVLVCSIVRDFAEGEALPHFPKPKGMPPIKRISHARLRIKNWIALSSVIVRKNTIDSVGRFNADRSHIAVEDYDMWIRLSRHGHKLLRLSSPLVHYRKLPTSISSSKTEMVRKALNVIESDYKALNRGRLFQVIKPIHWFLYIASSAWMRAIRREL
jgi:teichuronic acid biosynthesis glycosyltransferase TuaG